MNQQEMFGNAKWLGFDGITRTPVVRASFDAADTVKAEITICGLGYFELYINGRRVSEDLFVPVTSDYCHRNITVNGQPFDEVFRHRCYCLKFDILPFLKEGRNELGAALGPGFFCTGDLVVRRACKLRRSAAVLPHRSDRFKRRDA